MVTEMKFSSGSVIANFKLVKQIHSTAFTQSWLAEKVAPETGRAVLEIVTDSALASILKSERARFPRKRHPAHLLCRVCNIRAEPFYFLWEEFDSLTLQDLLKQKGRLDLKSSILVFAQLLDALNAAHSEGVLHLNLTPENIFVSAAGNVKVGGFGLGACILALKQHLGKVSASSWADITADYAYIAPEQKENRPPDVGADIYALGAILFQMVTGSRPLKGQKITDLRPDAPPTLDKIFTKATAAHPQRYTSVKEMAEEFEPIKVRLAPRTTYEQVQDVALSEKTIGERPIPAKPKTAPQKKNTTVTAPLGLGKNAVRKETEKRLTIEHKEKAILRTEVKARMPRILLFVALIAAAAIILNLIFFLPRRKEKIPTEVTRVTNEKEEKVKALLTDIDKIISTGKYDLEVTLQKLRTLRTQADGTTLIPQIDARIERLTEKFETDSRNEYENLMKRCNELIGAERFQDAIICLSTYPERFRKSAYWTEKISREREKAIYLQRAKDEFGIALAAFEREAGSIKPGQERATFERIRTIVDSFVRSYSDTAYSEQLTRRFNALMASSAQTQPVTPGPAQEEAKRTLRVAAKFENWTSPTIPSNSVTALASDNRGGILCATLSGVSRYDGKEWKQVILRDQAGQPHLEKENVTCILALPQTVWFGTPDGLYRENEGKVTLFQTADGLPANWIVCIACAPDSKQVWVGTTAGASIFDGIFWRNFTVKDGLADNNVNSILVTPRDALLATRGGLTIISRSETTTQEVLSCKSFTTVSGLPSNSVTALCSDSAGLWIGTEDGLSYTPGTVSPLSVKLTTYTTQSGLPSNSITCLAVDSSNNVFAGTRSGLAHFDGHNWTTYTKETGLASNEITALLVVGNYLYVGTHFGLSRIEFSGR